MTRKENNVCHLIKYPWNFDKEVEDKTMWPFMSFTSKITHKKISYRFFYLSIYTHTHMISFTSRTTLNYIQSHVLHFLFSKSIKSTPSFILTISWGSICHELFKLRNFFDSLHLPRASLFHNGHRCSKRSLCSLCWRKWKKEIHISSIIP